MAGLGDHGLIEITFSQLTATGYLECVISDNGPGILLARDNGPEKAGHLSKGSHITTERIRILNQLSGNSLPILITTDWACTTTNKPSGTRITLHFPVKPPAII